ncbi:MAG: uroporphyrinogen-III synthase [Chloroflexi bacterium]|nr:uroporphyrinogen-III synthase [Chloroflexota bacterium]
MTTTLPLSGRRVLVTRSRAQANGLMTALAALGAQAIMLPAIEIAPISDPTRLDQAIASLDAYDAYDWIIFTSVNGVAAFWQRIEATGARADRMREVAVAAIGPATAQALEEHGISPRFVPSEYIAETIAAGIGDVEGKHILLPRAEIAREALAVELRRRGAIVDEIAAYRTLSPSPDAGALAQLRQGVDAILFTSSSTVRNFVDLAGHIKSTGRVVIACIGPITAQTAREMGFTVDVVASEYTTDGLVRALVSHFQQAQHSQEHKQ